MTHTEQELIEIIERLQAENQELKYNKNYGILTRGALEIEHRKLTGDRYAVMIDIDYLHKLNSLYGSQEPVNAMIRQAFNIRHEDLLISGNWASGDEIAFIVRSNPEGFMARLAESLSSNGLSATMAYCKVNNNDLIAACECALEEVYKIKNNRGIESR